MIAPFLEHWIPQIFWLSLSWLVLFLFFRNFVFSWFQDVEKIRKSWRKKKMESAESLLQKAQEIDSYVEKERLKNENELRETIQKKRCESEAYIHSISSKMETDLLACESEAQKKLEDYKVQEMKKEESWEEAIRFFKEELKK